MCPCLSGGDANTVDDPIVIGNDGTNFYHPTAGDHSVIHCKTYKN